MLSEAKPFLEEAIFLAEQMAESELSLPKGATPTFSRNIHYKYILSGWKSGYRGPGKTWLL